MFGRFTEKAQHVIYYAQEEARAMNYPAVGTEHLLLGILQGRTKCCSKSPAWIGR